MSTTGPTSDGDPWGGNPPPLSLKNFAVLAAMFVAVMGILAVVVHPWAVAVDQEMRRERDGRAQEVARRIATPGSEPVWARAVVLSGVSGGELVSLRNPADQAPLMRPGPCVFRMGRDDGPVLERPEHEVELDGYVIYAELVNVDRYAQFLAASASIAEGTHRHPDEPPGKSRVPDGWDAQVAGPRAEAVTGVDWFDAYAYASWAGLRLPTEAEWERARTTIVGFAPVDTWEWCYDGFDPGYYGRSERRNPRGPSVAYDRVVRRCAGTATVSEPSRHKRSPSSRARDLGFRCAGTYAE